MNPADATATDMKSGIEEEMYVDIQSIRIQSRRPPFAYPSASAYTISI